MRPVNLIPADERRGDRAQLRTGVLPYVIVAALAAALVLVTLMTLTSSKISDREAEVASLEAQEAAAAARAEALRPYAEFAAMSVKRDATVTSLAQSRFDWERVLRELALVIPDDIWLTEATGTASASVQIEGETAIEGREEVAGPALELVGCGANQKAVAGFLAALRDIDGVTRVGLAASERVSGDTPIGSGSVTAGADADCRTRDAIAKFEIVVAFDAVPAPAVPGADPSTEPLPDGSTTAAADSGVAEVAAQEQAAAQSTAEQTDQAQEAANVVPGVSR
jgi:Tfp pilus assembly protein PilN